MRINRLGYKTLLRQMHRVRRPDPSEIRCVDRLVRCVVVSMMLPMAVIRWSGPAYFCNCITAICKAYFAFWRASIVCLDADAAFDDTRTIDDNESINIKRKLKSVSDTINANAGRGFTGFTGDEFIK